MINALIPYIDCIWIIIACAVITKRHWILFLGYFIACFITLRLQVELMNFIEYPNGILGFSTISAFVRGILFYSFAHLVLILTLKFAKDQNRIVLLASAGSIYFFALIISALAMIA